VTVFTIRAGKVKKERRKEGKIDYRRLRLTEYNNLHNSKTRFLKNKITELITCLKIKKIYDYASLINIYNFKDYVTVIIIFIIFIIIIIIIIIIIPPHVLFHKSSLI
jgi:hypothetical protein